MYPSGRDMGQGAAPLEGTQINLQSQPDAPDWPKMTWLVSTLTIVTLMAVSHVLRRLLRERVRGKLLLGCLLEMVAVAEVCCTSAELGIVADHYGKTAFSVHMFFMVLWRGSTYGTITASPCGLFIQVTQAGAHPLQVLLKLLAQLAAAYASSRIMSYLWVVELTQTHVGRTFEGCTADLQVPVVLGFLTEGLLTCVLELFSRTLAEVRVTFASILDSLGVVCMVLLAFDLSGGYFNPVLATGMKWGCLGHTNTEHLVVYWAGNLLGTWFSIRLWNRPAVRSALVGRFRHKAD